MTCAREIINKEQLEREFDSIRKVFKETGNLRIHWGTIEAMQEVEGVKSDFIEGCRVLTKETVIGKHVTAVLLRGMEFMPDDVGKSAIIEIRIARSTHPRPKGRGLQKPS